MFGSATLSDREVIGIVRKHIESGFPKDCARCGRRYDSLADYLLRTTHLGHPVSGDDPHKDPTPTRLIGTISFANCSCGNTLAISSAGIDVWTMWRLLQWAGASMSRRRMSIGEVLSDLRAQIDEEVLREHHRQDCAPARPESEIAPADSSSARPR